LKLKPQGLDFTGNFWVTQEESFVKQLKATEEDRSTTNSLFFNEFDSGPDQALNSVS
tara:strand:- start:431 stop:601 length:171 start_codon:yes stop_codon:yes gene_type:complete